MSAPDAVAEFVLAELETNLSTTLATIETAYDETLELGTATFWRTPQARYPGNLNIVVVVEESDPVNAGNLNRFTGRVEIIVAGEQDNATYPSSAVLNKRLWRVARGVQTLIHSTTLSAAVDVAYVEETSVNINADSPATQEQRATMIIHINEVV